MSLLEKVYFVVFTNSTDLCNWCVSQFWEFFKCAHVYSSHEKS